MRPRTIRAAVGAAVTLVAAFVAPTALTMPAAAAAAGTLAQAAGPHLGLIAVQQTVTVPESNDRPVLIDPDVWIASSGSFRLDVRRAGYTSPVTVTQIISTPRGAGRRALPGSLLDGWNGLGGFLHFTLSNAHGQVVDSQLITFCPDDPNSERATPGQPGDRSVPAAVRIVRSVPARGGMGTPCGLGRRSLRIRQRGARAGDGHARRRQVPGDGVDCPAIPQALRHRHRHRRRRRDGNGRDQRRGGQELLSPAAARRTRAVLRFRRCRLYARSRSRRRPRCRSSQRCRRGASPHPAGPGMTG